MGWFGNLIGTDKAMDNMLDKDKGLFVRAGGWIDGLGFTDQEKSEAKGKVRDWATEHLKALAPFKVMQRIMVTIITIEWAILFNVTIVAICLDATTVTENLLKFMLTQFAWMPIAGAVGLYLMGGVIPSRTK